MTTYQSEITQIPDWKPIEKPAEIAERRLVEAILGDVFPTNTVLPAERELADSLGVTRPTLREALQRLARDGWLEIHQGKPTRVRDYWKEGKLSVLNALAEYPGQLPDDFIPNLLNVRMAMAPMYTCLAIVNDPEQVIALLEESQNLDETPQKYAEYDWQLQHELTILSGNPVFTMILNGFKDMYLNLAPGYFSISEARRHSMQYYQDLIKAAKADDAPRAKSLTENIMRESLKFWQQTKYH